MIPRLHLVTDDAILTRDDFLPRAREVMIQGGGDVAVHLRGPGLTGRTLFDHAAALGEAARESGALLLVNDRLDVALALGLRGAHLGQRSLPPGVARRLLGPHRLLGLSVHDEEEGREGEAGVVDFLLVGTLFSTPSHPGRVPNGLDLLPRLRATHPLPLVGIGGITPERVGAAMAAGADGVAVRGGVWEARDPARSAGVYLTELERLSPHRSPGAGRERGGLENGGTA